MFSISPLFVLTLAGTLVSGIPVRSKRADANVFVLQFADVLEQLESSFYAQAISKFQASDFTAAGFSSSQIPVEQFMNIQNDESTHSAVLQAALKTVGASPITNCNFNFDAALTDVATMAATARVVENVGVAAYLGAAAAVTDPIILQAAGSILTVEARHSTVLNILSANGTSVPSAFDMALKPEEVLTIASPFISGCDLGIKPFPTLAVTNTATPGTLLAFQSPAMDGTTPTDQLFCQMMIGGTSMSIPFPLNECVIPYGVNGPVALFVTSDGQPLANNVINRASDKILAGPTIYFVDTKPQVLGQLARGSNNNGEISSTATLTISPEQATSIMQGGSAPTETATATSPAGDATVTDSPSSDASSTDTASSATVTAPSDGSSTGSAGEPTATDAPSSSEPPSTDATSTDAPSTDAPPTNAPSTDAPPTNAPSTDAPSTDGGFIGETGGPNTFKGETSDGITVLGWSNMP